MTGHQDFQSLHLKADAAGRAAADACQPTPMVVGEAKSLFSSEIDHSKPTYYVPDGPCGFAWVHFKGNTSWGRWAKKQKLATPDYPAGLHIWVRGYGQSVQLKEAYAEAYAKVLRDHGIAAYAGSRLD